MKNHKSRGATVASRTMAAAVMAVAGLSVVPLAHAARKGSVPEYPVGITMGTPTGALPPKAGLYVIWKPNYSESYSLNGNGDRTGVTSTAWASNAQLMWVPGIKVLGANYAVFVRNIGLVNVTLHTPTGFTISNAGKPDTDLVPVNLSWKVGKHVFFDAELGIYLDDGAYENKPGRINIGQNEHTIEPNFSLSYLDQNWSLTAHAIFDINGWNHDAGFVDGQKVSYRNGNTFDLDWTAFHKTGHWSYGLVGYFLRQISDDEGPVELNAGKPEEYAAGVGASYRFGRVSLIANFTQDYHARNVGKKHMFMVVLSFKAL